MNEEKLYTKAEVENCCNMAVENKRRHLTVADILNNPTYDVNCEYEVYRNTWDNGGVKIWDSMKDGRINNDDAIATECVTYMTVALDTCKIILEVS